MTKLIAAAVLLLSWSVASADTAAIFGSRCAACHGKDGKGAPAGKALGVKDLTVTKLSEAELVTVISDGRNKMPPQKASLKPDEIQALAKYIKAGLK